MTQDKPDERKEDEIPHKNVTEYDGAFNCNDCHSRWGALPGEPQMPKECIDKDKPEDRTAESCLEDWEIELNNSFITGHISGRHLILVDGKKDREWVGAEYEENEYQYLDEWINRIITAEREKCERLEDEIKLLKELVGKDVQYVQKLHEDKIVELRNELAKQSNSSQARRCQMQSEEISKLESELAEAVGLLKTATDYMRKEDSDFRIVEAFIQKHEGKVDK